MAGATIKRLLTAAEIDAAIASSPRILAAGNALAHHAADVWEKQIPEFDPSRSRRSAPPEPKAVKRGAPPPGKPGDAQRSIRVTPIFKRGKWRWRVGSDSFVVAMMEFGSKHMPKIAAREKTLKQLKGGA